jgi:hypothetical protein
MYLAKLKKSGRPGRGSGIAAGGFSACRGADAPHLRSGRANAGHLHQTMDKVFISVAAPVTGCRSRTQRTNTSTGLPKKFELRKILTTALKSDRAPWLRRARRISHSRFPLR